ncbi:MAG: hypothetical protein QOJ52_295 [Acidimicrobiaceae bacterium]|nr:hypothetical protein [Acidimicrobiaceae bacterium]MDQ1418333.1 hypothetical protein [Acidimicrobiaceae bacterium]
MSFCVRVDAHGRHRQPTVSTSANTPGVSYASAVAADSLKYQLPVVGCYASRRMHLNAMTTSAAASVRKMPDSITWKAQKRFAGW